ncbi:hypothetical protein HGH92_25035 [Chitinophaga varians]|uniref:Uncharacterized protein n=1 Tax=Chitinophaga varians TaxID=2202339 RepID=A0A847RWW7_9BACT|nr:hypothetical protein [Chitinophaga varians]NLR67593.1 hypothetical protein [Chitinophaga varians]
MGLIVFYEGNNGTQDIVQTVEDVPGQNFQPAKHEQIRSMKLYGVRQGCRITVYDSPDGSTKDDFSVVNVKRTSPEYTVDTFERSYEDETVVVSFIRINSQDGKISRIKID